MVGIGSVDRIADVGKRRGGNAVVKTGRMNSAADCNTLSGNIRAQSVELRHDSIEIWVNEGGVGGEPDESTPRPLSRG